MPCGDRPEDNPSGDIRPDPWDFQLCWKNVIKSNMINSPSQKAEMVMRALVYHGPGQMAWEKVPKPEITNDTDAIVRVDATTICGTDLHILKGDLPAVTDGRILGHEAVGTVDSVGAGVKTVKAGDRVLVSCVSVCGTCRFCREGRPGQCLGGGGWILGYMIDGTQAEYVRVPFADASTYPVPEGAADEDILMLADILPTG
jgi:alcohol dehydrogenase